MAAKKFQIGGVVWRAFRYWNNLDLAFSGFGGRAGWNTTFVPYSVLRFTRKRIKVMLLADSINGKEATEKDREPLFLDRSTMEQKGKQYHTRYHEYFYAAKPVRDPEQGGQPINAISILNLSTPHTESDVRRAYKRLARIHHPDNGGSNAAFIELKQAHDEALRLAVGE